MEQVKIIEVGPRDGLQNVASFVPTDKKIQFIKKLAACGIKEMQIGSFVNPRAIPQFSDMDEIVQNVSTLPDISLSTLVPNISGAQKAASRGIRKIIFFFSISKSHNLCNVRQTPQESIKELRQITRTYGGDPDISLQVALATAFGCPFEGDIKTAAVLRAVDNVAACGIKEITLCDTVGLGNPAMIEKKFSACRQRFPEIMFGAHFHNTRGLALANTLRAYDIGIRHFEAATGGLGGCPYAPQSSGNAATEEIVFMFQEMGIITGIDLTKLCGVCRFLKKILPRTNIGGLLLRAGLPKKHKFNFHKQEKIK
ncbi:MAG TPA: hydroxymethylglutaryl-CoA lyase [Smithellaceae bacterium]|nr:hydroxymethylglutaryl-CoA lyase [Smithellaceae bacterium]